MAAAAGAAIVATVRARLGRRRAPRRRPARSTAWSGSSGRRADGELRTTEPECAPDPTQSRSRRSGATAAGDFAIGYHYDGANLTGSSFTVVGADCIGRLR